MRTIKIPFLGDRGKERPVSQGPQAKVISPEEASRESTLQFLASDPGRLPTRADVLSELNVLPAFRDLQPDVKEKSADEVMARRQEKNNSA